MQLSKEIILKMLSELKVMKVAASSVEKELGFSNGLLGKGMLSDEKSDKFYDYFFNKTGKLLATLVTQEKEKLPALDTEKLQIRLEALVWVKEVEEYCNTAGITPQELISAHRNQNKPYKKLKQGKEEENTSVSYIGNPKTKIVNPVYEGSNAFFLRHGASTWEEVKKLKGNS